MRIFAHDAETVLQPEPERPGRVVCRPLPRESFHGPDGPVAQVAQDRQLVRDDVHLLLMEGGVSEKELSRVVDLLLWSGFLGLARGEDERYAYQYLYNLPKLEAFVDSYESKATIYCIHPAFRKALEVQ